MNSRPDDQRGWPAPPPPDVEGADEVTHYAAAPPIEGEQTQYGATAPPPADQVVADKGEVRADPGQTTYPLPCLPVDSDATRYPAAADAQATRYPPSGGKMVSPSGTRLSRVFAGHELLEEIGHGGMGVVYKARQVSLNRLVALKMIRSGELACDSDIRHFRTEANEAARLDHPNIVPVYEVGECLGRHFFTMKLYEGGCLDHHRARFANDRKAAARLMVAVARAVHYAHQRQLLHRDLKPGNILLDADGQAHVADFGLAKRLGSEGEASQSILAGTPEYMAPEQARGERLTTAVDVYALGGILYALLTGRPPFRAASHWETIQQLLSQAPTLPSKLAPGCPRDLETVCLKCLDKEPSRRYGSAEALAEELERWLKDEPVRARPAGRLRRAWCWCRRDPALASVVAALLLTIVASLAVVSFLYVKAQRQRRMAERRQAEAQSITRFYEQHVLAAARPKALGGSGKDVTVRQALDGAVQKIDEDFAGQPELEATVCHTLGMTYQILGELQAAKPLLEKAYSIRLEVLGPDDPRTLASLHDLAFQRWREGECEEAVPLARQVLERRRRMLGREHEDTLDSQLLLGQLLAEHYQLEEAESLLRDAIDCCRRSLGPDHHHTLSGQNDLAWVLNEQGRHEEALVLDQQTLEGCRRSLPPDHPDTLRSMGNLANSFREVGKLKEATDLAQEALQGHQRVLGGNHIETLQAMSSLAVFFAKLGQLDKSGELDRQILQRRRQVLGPTHPHTLLSEANLGHTLTLKGQHAEAEELLLHSLKGRKDMHGENSPDALFSQHNLALLREEQGKVQEAEALYRETLEARRRAHGTQHSLTLATQNRLAGLLHKQGRLEEAERLFSQILTDRRKTLRSDHLDLAATLADYSRLLIDHNRPQEAEPLLHECLEIRQKKLPPGHWQIAGARALLGGCLLRQNLLARAEPILVTGCEELHKARWVPRKTMAWVLDRVIELYEKKGTPERAEPWRKMRLTARAPAVP